ncbi:MAG: cobalamin B12-binding domain-containing protein, partial [Erysipelotrichaceae bacterium]
MKEKYQKFLELLSKEDRLATLHFVHNELLPSGISMMDLYEYFLVPSLSVDLECNQDQDEDLCIFQEHVRTNIIKAIIESCAHLLEPSYNANQNHHKVVVMCPAHEQHDLGARMVADYFTTLGWDVIFAGANTPIEALIKGMQARSIRLAVLSISNYYNLSEGKRMLLALKAASEGQFRVIIGGTAFVHNQHIIQEFQADYYAKDLESLDAIAREVLE